MALVLPWIRIGELAVIKRISLYGALSDRDLAVHCSWHLFGVLPYAKVSSK